ncbi:MAG: hypothetical protein D3923_17415, partial [Candidatus Electrothrix sp. AR3]|nr:hypothetical protein [Candidatus Electrothrix sp. AR3]
MVLLKVNVFFFVGCILLCIASSVSAFQEAGCGAGDCRDCHALNRREAADLLKDKGIQVLGVKRSEVPGLWDVDAIYQGKKRPFYLDFSKKYLISGSLVKLDGNESLTQKNFVSMNRVDLSKIPLADAIIIGNSEAPNRIIIFDDPECAFCKKLHPELKKVVSNHPDIAFFIKMFPLASHPNARAKAQTIICAKLLGRNEKAKELLADCFAGSFLPPPA